MNTYRNFKSKIGILFLIPVIGFAACSGNRTPGQPQVTHFARLLFSIPSTVIGDSIRMHHPDLIPLFKVFNEEIIRIGPDSLADYPEQLDRFKTDTMIRTVFDQTEALSQSFSDSYILINKALQELDKEFGTHQPVELVPFISGFNQAYITMPGLLGIGLDQYLGEENIYYKGMGIPVYVRKYMNPEYLPADAVRAWLYSELPQPDPEGGFLERMIFEGKVYYLAAQLLPKVSEGNLFHYTDEQLDWCRDQEEAMWKYLAEQKILFSTDRFTIRKFMDEAPFTRDFGNDSPGRTGTWIGYRVISSYMKANRKSLKELVELQDARAILSASKYHP